MATSVNVNPVTAEDSVRGVKGLVSTAKEDPIGIKAEVAVGDVKVPEFTVSVNVLDKLYPA